MDKPTPHEELETMFGALVAQLHETGLLSMADIEAIARRLHQAGMPETAEDVRAIPFIDALSKPSLELLRDGGNGQH